MLDPGLPKQTLVDWPARSEALTAVSRRPSSSSLLDSMVASAIDDAYQHDVLEARMNEEFGGPPDNRHHLTIAEYMARVPQAWKDKWKGRTIKREDWRPEDVCDPNVELDEQWLEFYLSHIPRFDKLIPYEEFFLYIEQAARWHEETKDLDVGTMDEVEAREFALNEGARIEQNKLYGLNRYIRIQEDLYPEGRKYESGTPQAFLAFLYDRGNDILLLKGRQAAITTTMMAIIVLDMFCKKDFRTVLLTDDKIKTGMGILDSKVQATVQLLPTMFTQELEEDGTLWHKEGVTLSFETADTKMDRRRNASHLTLMSSNDSQAVNSKTPTVTLYDEVQNIELFRKIRKEVSPTQIAEVNGRHIKVRQQIAWGTGSSNDRGKGVFQEDWFGMYNALKDGKPTGGWLALFFDWTCRPKFTAQSYINERRKELADHSGDEESGLAIFYSHYPSDPMDSFMARHNGIVPPQYVKKNRDMLRNMPDHLRPVVGMFKPIYQFYGPEDKTPVRQRKLIGAEFIDLETLVSRGVPMQQAIKACMVQMFMRPDNNYIARYFQGTDPIQSATGRSQFSSAIWDRFGIESSGCCGTEHPHLHPTVACIINGRTQDPEEMYLQAACMSIHYRNHGQAACRELVERNQGQNYIAFKQLPWINHSAAMVMATELKDEYNTGKGSPEVGFWMDTASKATLLSDLERIYYTYGHNIKFADFHSQFAEIEVVENDNKRKTFGTRDYDKFNDDIVIAIGLSKICADSVGRGRPEKFGGLNAPKEKVRTALRRVPNGMGGTSLVQVQEVYTPKYV